MHKIIFFSILTVILSACGSKPTKEEKAEKKKALFGNWKGQTYVNPMFNFKIDFEDTWDIDSNSFQTSFGGELFETTYSESVQQNFPINIVMEAKKANPFGKPSSIEQLEESKEGYEMIFGGEGLVLSDIQKTTIAGEDFAYYQAIIIEEGDSSFINEYTRYHEGYYLIMVAIYNTREDEAATKEFINGIERIK